MLSCNVTLPQVGNNFLFLWDWLCTYGEVQLAVGTGAGFCKPRHCSLRSCGGSWTEQRACDSFLYIMFFLLRPFATEVICRIPLMWWIYFGKGIHPELFVSDWPWSCAYTLAEHAITAERFLSKTLVAIHVAVTTNIGMYHHRCNPHDILFLSVLLVRLLRVFSFFHVSVLFSDHMAYRLLRL